MKSFETPILFLVFNRPEETKRVFESLRAIAPAYLFLAADGPRQNVPGEFELCESVRKIIENVDWDCEVKVLFREKNLGCRKAVSEAITWFFEDVEQGIILEDDCLPAYSFFFYCEELLQKYKNDERIFSIGGTNLDYKFNNDYSYAYSRFMNMWGWATWRRSSNLVDYNMTKWKNMRFKLLFLQRRLQKNIFSFDYNWLKYWEYFFNLTSSAKIDTWDYQWIFTQLYYNKLSVFPAQNLIKNIGFSNTATHTFFPNHQIAQFKLLSISFPLIHPNKKIADTIYEKNSIKKIWFSYREQSIIIILRNAFLQKILKLYKQIKNNRTIKIDQ